MWAYFVVFWLIPAMLYVDGLKKRRSARLAMWCFNLFIHMIALMFSSVMVLYNHLTTSYLYFDNYCVVATIFLVLTPLWLAPFFLSVLVYVYMDKKNIMNRPPESVIFLNENGNECANIDGIQSNVHEEADEALNENGTNEEAIGENELPTYNELENSELPKYDDLGTTRVQIGKRIIVIDKSLEVSTFKNSSDV